MEKPIFDEEGKVGSAKLTLGNGKLRAEGAGSIGDGALAVGAFIEVDSDHAIEVVGRPILVALEKLIPGDLEDGILEMALAEAKALAKKA